MRDIWGVPPGGFDSGEKRKRPWLRATIAGFLILSLGIGGGFIVSSMNKSTGVSTDTALAEFRSSKSSDTSANAAKSTKQRKTSTKKSAQKRGAGRVTTGGGSTTGGSAPVATTENDQAAADTAGSTKSNDNNANAAPATTVGPPAEGVYSWTIDGYEKAPGVNRRLPKHSNRIITHEGDNNWTEHHIFSEQREEWFGLGVAKDGVFTRQVRNRVEMGPVEVDKTVVYDPVMYVTRFPWDAGQAWSGSWKGKTSGTYSAKCLEHGYLMIGGERIEVWVTEVHMEMHGDVEGTTTVKSWVSPEYRLVVKQYQESRVSAGPGDYYSEWTGQVDSVHPQT